MKILSSILKSFHFIMKMIIKSKNQFDKKNEGKEELAFFEKINALIFNLSTILTVNSNDKYFNSDSALDLALYSAFYVSQDYCIKNLSYFLESLLDIFDAETVGNITGKFILLIPLNIRPLTTENKLYFISEISKSKLVINKSSRAKILPSIITQINTHINQTSIERKLCADILGNLFNLLQDKKLFSLEETNEFVKEIIMVLPKFIESFNDLNAEKSRMMQKLNLNEENQLISENEEFLKITTLKSDFTSIFLTIFYLIDSNIIEEFCLDVFKPLFNLTKTFLTDSSIPEFWISFNVFQFNSILKLLVESSKYLLNVHLEKFDKTYWDPYFETLLLFILSNRLNLKNFSLSKQSKLTVNGDLRVDASELFSNLWDSLEDRQIEFIGQLLDPVLRLANISNPKISQSALKLYSGIIKCEFSNTKQLKETEGTTAKILDEFIVNDIMDDTFKDFFLVSLEKEFSDQEEITNEGLKLSAKVKEMIKLIKEVQNYKDDEEDLKTSSLLKVMNYFKDANREELYLKYVQTLAKTHENIGNHVEAGMTLCKYILINK
jgi:hypothetical protein